MSDFGTREFVGFAGAGPLTIGVEDTDDPMIHVGLGESGMYITVRQATQIERALIQARQRVEWAHAQSAAAVGEKRTAEALLHQRQGGE